MTVPVHVTVLPAPPRVVPVEVTVLPAPVPSPSSLTRFYDAARHAVAEAHRVDDVKDILDKSLAMQVYAKQAKDETLIQQATEIRLRAERRLGELMRDAPKARGGDNFAAANGRAGYEQTHTNEPPSLAEQGVDKNLANRARKTAALSDEAFEEKIERTAAKAVSAITGVRSTQWADASHDWDWYTPAEYVELVREVLGVIDVDPASSAKAQETVQAGTFYTVETDGLAHDWHGRLYMNPPYSNPEVVRFADKLLLEIDAGHVTEAIVLTNNCADAQWHGRLQDRATRICFTRGRVKFVSGHDDAAGSPAIGQSFFYFGNRPQIFERVFSGVGRVYALASAIPTVKRNRPKILGFDVIDFVESYQKRVLERMKSPDFNDTHERDGLSRCTEGAARMLSELAAVLIGITLPDDEHACSMTKLAALKVAAPAPVLPPPPFPVTA